MSNPITAADLVAMFVPTAAPRSPRLASVDPDYLDGAARVTFEGEAELTQRGYGWLAPYSPNRGDRVLMVPVGKGGWIIVGGVTLALDSQPGTIPISGGGTGASTEAGARANLGVYSKTEVDAALLEIGIELVDEVNALIAAHATEELAQRNAAIAAHAAAEVTARNAAIAAAFNGGATLRLRSPDGTLWTLGVDNSGALTTTEVP